eukprot:tig00001214_g7544.t1
MARDSVKKRSSGGAREVAPPAPPPGWVEHEIRLWYRPAGSAADALNVCDAYKINENETDPYGRLLNHACYLTGIPADEMQLRDERWRLLQAHDFLGAAVLRITKVTAGRHGDTFRERIETVPSTDLYRNLTKDLNFTFALTELIDNSVEATKANHNKDRLIEVRIDRTSRTLEIADNGWGMSEEEIRNFAKLGKSMNIKKNVQPDVRDAEEQHKYYMDSALSRYGVGAKTAMFYLGPVVKIGSKVPQSDRINHVTMSLREMEGTERHEADFESTEASEEEKTEGSFTHIEIREVSQEKLEEYLRDREQVHRFLSEVYHFYLHGGFKGDPRRGPGELGGAFTPISLSIVEYDDELLPNGETERRTRRYVFGPEGAAPDEREAEEREKDPRVPLSDAAFNNEVRQLHEAFFPPAEAEAGPSDGLARQGDKELRWERTIEVPVKDRDTGEQRAVRAQLALVYYPVRRNKESMPAGMTPGLTVVWQGRCMPPLNASKQATARLAFMERPKRDVKRNDEVTLPADCWDRVKGFLFVSRTVEPTCHKTQLAETAESAALCSTDTKSPLYKELYKEFRERLKAWHALDDEVSAGRELEPFRYAIPPKREEETIGRVVEWAACGKIKIKGQEQVRIKYDKQVYTGTVIKVFVYDAEFLQRNRNRNMQFTNEPSFVFREIHVERSSYTEWLVPVTCITGTVKDKEWKEMLENLKRKGPRGVRFVDRDEYVRHAGPAGATREEGGRGRARRGCASIKKKLPERMTADETLEYVAAEVYNGEEEAGKQRVEGMGIREAVPHLWLLLYLRKADTEVAHGGRTLKAVKIDASVKGIPEELRTMQAAKEKDGKASKEKEEYVAINVFKISAQNVERNLFYLRDIHLPHRGIWKFRLVPVRVPATKKGEPPAAPVILSAPTGKLAAETRSVEIVAGSIVQIEAAFRSPVDKVGAGETLPDIVVYPQDQWGNMMAKAPAGELVAKISLSASSKADFEVVPDSVSRSATCLGGHGVVLLRGARLRLKPGAAPKLPADVSLAVQLGPARNEDSVSRISVRVAAGPPARLELLGSLAVPGPALVRGAALEDLALRAVDKDGNPAEPQPKPVHIRLQGDGVTIAPAFTSRPMPASGVLEYKDKVRVTANYGAAGVLRAAIEGVEGSELEVPFTVAPRVLRVALPEPLPDGFALLRSPEPPRRKPPPPAPSSSASKRRKRDAEAAPAAAPEAAPEAPEEAALPEGLPSAAWVLRAREGAPLRGAFVEVVSPTDWGEVETGVKGEGVDLSWDAGAGPRMQAGRARLPELVPSSLEGAPGAPRLAHVTFAGLTATFAFLLHSEPPAALRPASSTPTAVSNREPASCALRLESAGGAALPVAAFAATARLAAELVDSPLALELAEGGLACAAGPDGTLAVSGWALRGTVGDGAGTALLRLRVEHSEPALPEEARTVDVPLAVAAGPAVRLAWQLQEEGGAAGQAGRREPLRVLNGACLPPIVVRAEDADGSLAASHAGTVTVVPGDGLEHAGGAQQLRAAFSGGRALFSDLRFTAGAEQRGRGGAVKRRSAPAAAPAPAALPEPEPVRVVVLPNPERPAALRLLQAGAPAPTPLRAVAGAELHIAVEVLGETGERTRLPAGAQAVLRGPVYLFAEAAAPGAAGEYTLHAALEPAGRAAVPPLSASLTVEAGPPHALEALLPGGAKSLATGTDQALPALALRLVDASGNACRPAGSLAVACRVEGEEGARVPSLAAAPRLLTAEGSAEFSGLSIGDGASGAYTLVFELQGGPAVLPARLSFTFLSASEARAEAEQRREWQNRLQRLADDIERREQEVKEAAGEAAGAGQNEAATGAAVGQLEGRLGSPPDLPAFIAATQRALDALRTAPHTALRSASHYRSSSDRARPGIEAFLQDARRGGIAGFFGLVCNLARVEDDRVAEALACWLGDRAQAAVFDKDENIRGIKRNRAYEGLQMIPLHSFTDDQFWRGGIGSDPQRKLLLPEPPAGARHLVNELVLEKPEQRRTLWYYLCRDTLIVDSEQQRNFIVDKVWHGKIQGSIVVLPQRDGRGAVDGSTCEVTRRNAIVRAGQRAEARATFASTRSLQSEIADVERRLEEAQALLARRAELAQKAAASQALRAAVAEKSAALGQLKAEREALQALLRAGGQPRPTTAGPSSSSPGGPEAAAKRGPETPEEKPGPSKRPRR